MATEVKKEVQLEMAHVLFVDIAGYSKLMINKQRALLETLNQIARSTDEFQGAEAAGRLLKIPTGDGLALVFYNSQEEPVECALQMSRALKEHPEIHLRMGIHSGPVSGIVDVNGRANVAGAGINMAQRVMDCGDAGHILLSKRVAEDLGQYGHWQPHLHNLGECEVKHGVRVQVVNLHTEELGNPKLPDKFRSNKQRKLSVPGSELSTRPHTLLVGLMVVAVLVVTGALIFSHRSASSLANPGVKKSSTLAAPIAPEKSIAVLPFENMSRDPDNAFFADGVQDEILTYLAKIADLKVISRTSVMAYKNSATHNIREIGQQLGVAHLLEGSVQRAANHIRVQAQLIDTRTDAHQWAEHYDRDLADVFAVQSEIAETIANQLKAKLSPTEKLEIETPPTTDLAANDFYERAKLFFASTSFTTKQKADLLEAVQLLDQAVARDPSFLRAYCLLARAHGNIYSIAGDHTPARLALADTATQNALRLAPNSGEAHLARASNLYYCHRDYDGARAELAIAAQTLPNDSHIPEMTGYIDRRRGRSEEGLRNLQRALEMDPRNYFILEQLAFSYKDLRRYPEEVAALDRVLAIIPKDAGVRVGRAEVDLQWRADTRPMHTTIASILAEDPAAAESVANRWIDLALCERDADSAGRALAALGKNTLSEEALHFPAAFAEGLIARMTHDDAKARAAFAAARKQQEKVVAEQPDYGPALCVLGLIDAGLGRREDALREGKRAVELMPVSKDTINGPLVFQFFAVIATWTGEKDLAIKQLTLAVPQATSSIHYGFLKLHPYWDPLRGDPRFEKIVAALAPKEKQ
jgi:TolB-like protein/class 3 adenylate cyclase/Tfp pilus assembly protein PilF